MERLREIIVSGNALNGILMSAIECDRKEPRGFLFGEADKDRFLCEYAYNLGNVERNPTSARYSNNRAIGRIVRFANLMGCIKPKEFGFVGGYHTHNFNERDDLRKLSELSHEDASNKGLMSDDMLSFNQEQWVELIVRIQCKDKTPKMGDFYREKSCENRMTFLITKDSNEFYRITLSSFLMKPNSLYKEVKKNKTNRTIQIFDVYDMKINIGQ